MFELAPLSCQDVTTFSSSNIPLFEVFYVRGLLLELFDETVKPLLDGVYCLSSTNARAIQMLSSFVDVNVAGTRTRWHERSLRTHRPTTPSSTPHSSLSTLTTTWTTH
jgi:hypothetical protein